MHRWTARFLLLVMLVPAFGPLALARIASRAAMHCMRQPLRQAAGPAQSSMHCHHGMAQARQPESPKASFRALDCCCRNHDCCRGLKTSEWARPAAVPFSFVSQLIEPALTSPLDAQASADRSAPDSARAPPFS